MNKNKSHIPISKNLSQQHYNIPMKRIYRIFVKKKKFQFKEKKFKWLFLPRMSIRLLSCKSKNNILLITCNLIQNLVYVTLWFKKISYIVTWLQTAI